jgi:membrane-bound lytic murein transglycosylase D
LKQWNHLRSNNIYPNQRLIVWVYQPQASDSSYYIVRPGDTLWSIAQRHNLSIEQLHELNPSLKGNSIVQGQRLRIR